MAAIGRMTVVQDIDEKKNYEASPSGFTGGGGSG